MTTIHAMYERQPSFTANDQQPGATRYTISAGIFTLADCTGGAPTAAEIQAHLNPPANSGADLASRNNAVAEDDLSRAIEANDTKGALLIVQTLLQERR